MIFGRTFVESSLTDAAKLLLLEKTGVGRTLALINGNGAVCVMDGIDATENVECGWEACTARVEEIEVSRAPI